MGDKTGKEESSRRKAVNARLRDFFASLLSHLKESTEGFWRRVDEKLPTGQQTPHDRQ
jgi:hypothetical protein